MIKINKDNSYFDEFSKELSICLYKELKKAIEQKKVLKPSYKEDSTEEEKKKNTITLLGSDDIKCLKYLKDNIKKLISSNIDTQKIMIDFLKKECPSLTKKYNKNDSKSSIYKAIKYIFVDRGYEAKISSAKDGEIAYRLVKEIGVNTCPYCNRNYISAITKDKKEESKTRPQLDHFYPKAIYPFLACSFYNLIPSCSACNLMKSDKDSFTDKLISPYEMETENFKFSYDLNNIDILNIGINESAKYDYKDSINIIFDKKVEINEKYFELEKLYNQEHRDIVIELLVKKAYYPQSYIEELSTFGFSKDEIYRYLFSNYNQDDDLHKRPLSKLVRDISDELGLI